MFSRIHARLGTAGFVVAVLALIAALAGSAFAAATLSGPEKKQVKKIATQVAKTYAGVTGPVGPAGPAGKDGTNGTNGKDGATGPQGPTGKTGSTGEAGVCSVSVPECVLPQGATVTGDWSFIVPQGGAANNGAEIFVTASFPLQVNLDTSAVTEWVATGSTYDPSACPGSVSEPEAAPGRLCFYAKELFNAGTAPCSKGDTYTGDVNSGKTLVFCIENASNEAYGAGSWAASSK